MKGISWNRGQKNNAGWQWRWQKQQ